MSPATPSNAPALSIGVLGALSALRDGRALDLGSLRQRAVLAALIVADGRPLSTDSLIYDVWQDTPPRSAVGTLHSYVSHLRRALEPGKGPRTRNSVLRSRDGRYSLAVGRLRVDVWAVQDTIDLARRRREQGRTRAASAAFEAALGRWRGEAYTELQGYRFARREAFRLEELRLSAVEMRADCDLSWGRDPHAVVRDLNEPSSQEPAREGLSRALMAALCRAGRFNDAVRVFDRTRRVLAAELGTDPGPELRQAFTAALRQQTHLTGPA
ncbi:BTAD domain-containing putative transcriptional regulator [Streptomyces sp. NPDC001250]|uniref:AfsR/SARP family transcriptional regulator n=1 Tax=unclassified Streptomyces TaxID=2593676 RepID=UPI0033271703